MVKVKDIFLIEFRVLQAEIKGLIIQNTKNSFKELISFPQTDLNIKPLITCLNDKIIRQLCHNMLVGQIYDISSHVIKAY